MLNPLTCKLEQFARLSADDHVALDRLAGERLRRLDARQDVIREGDRPHFLNLVLEGWACRYKVLADGRRQIVAFFVPGDLCDLNVYLLRQMDHSIGAITDLTYAEISSDLFDEATEGRPRLMRAMWWDSLVTAAIQREWTTDIGQRSALERIAHLFLELFLRLEAVGLVQDESCPMPLTQNELADAMGMTPVHANRTIRDLRASGTIELSGRRLTVLDRSGLAGIAQFDPAYLHLQRDGRHLDANA